MQTKTLMFAAFAALTALAGSAGGAMAGHRHFHGFHHNPHFFLRIGPPARDCRFYREMWEETGFFKWKKRYYICKGWW